MATPQPDAGNCAIVVLAEQADGGERLLAHFVETLEHAGDQITAHEYFGQFIVVFVFTEPDGVVVEVVFVPEIFQWDGFFFVGVDTFEIFEVECTCLDFEQFFVFVN